MWSCAEAQYCSIKATYTQALAALVPAWRAAGRPNSDLVADVAAGLPSAAPHRRRPLLSAVLHALPQVRSQCTLRSTARDAVFCAEGMQGLSLVMGSYDMFRRVTQGYVSHSLGT